MERDGTPRCWAHRVIVPLPQEERQRGDEIERERRERRRLSISNASQIVTTTKTNKTPLDQTSFIHGRLQNACTSQSRTSQRLQPKPPSLPRSAPVSSSITPCRTTIHDIGDEGSEDLIHLKSSRDHLRKQQSAHRTLISEGGTNELINHGSCINGEQASFVARLSRASLQEVDSQHHPRRRLRRKSIGSRSFLSDDTNSVSSGYGSLPAYSEESINPSTKKLKNGNHGDIEPKPPLLRKRRNSYSVGQGEKLSKAEYLKAFNDSIRQRNAKKVSRQRPSTANNSLPDIGTSSSRKWRNLRLLIRSAPIRGRRASMDNGANDSWEEFVALGMPVDDLIDLEKASSDAQSLRSIQNITSSREHERILNEFKFAGGDSKYKKDGAFKKSIMVIAGGMRCLNVDGKLSPRAKETSKTPDVEAVIEEEESESGHEDIDAYQEAIEISSSKIRSRGWRIVKARLSEIAEKAPKNGIDSTPLTFKNIAQLVKAKQFRMMLKRRASFMENGRFQFEEAKQDLYARYKIDPVLVSKLTYTPREPRDGQGEQSNSGSGAKK